MFVSVETSGTVTVVGVDRPPANAISIELLDEPWTRSRIGCRGAGRRGDRRARWVLLGRSRPEGGAGVRTDVQRRMVSGINRMVLATYGMPCPVIAAVTGHAIAGGLVLALCADLRIASLEGRYGLTEIKVGVPYPQAAIGVVRAELPSHAARRLVLSNELIDGTEALGLGLFDEVLEPDAVLPRALTIATEMAAFPADVYAATKRELRSQPLDAIRAAVESEPLLEGWLGA